MNAQHIEFSIEGVSYSCQGTGKCCVQNLVVLNTVDIARLSYSIHEDVQDLYHKKILTYTINKANYWMSPMINYHLGPQGACPFLIKDADINDSTPSSYTCIIYNGRPFVCRLFPLEYNPFNKDFQRSLRNEMRCPECVTSEEKPLVQYLEEQDVLSWLPQYDAYFALQQQLIQQGYTILSIKGNKSKQKQFFAIQHVLYEVLPVLDNPVENLMEAVRERVENVINTHG